MKRQRGMSLVAALFVIVVLAMLSLFAIRVGASGEQDVSSAAMRERAAAAARSGIEYGAHRAMVGLACNAAAGVNFPAVVLNQGALTGFTLSVSCYRSVHVHNGAQYPTYEITSTARRGVYGTPDYVARTMTKVVAPTLP